jgi:topoisomerase-4 subunit A
MKDEEDNIIPEDDNLENQDNSSNEEGFEDIHVSTGHHFYENNENPEDTITKVTGMYKDWFLDYASYVILERAVPAIEDVPPCVALVLALVAPAPPAPTVIV